MSTSAPTIPDAESFHVLEPPLVPDDSTPGTTPLRGAPLTRRELRDREAAAAASAARQTLPGAVTVAGATGGATAGAAAAPGATAGVPPVGALPPAVADPQATAAPLSRRQRQQAPVSQWPDAAAPATPIQAPQPQVPAAPIQPQAQHAPATQAQPVWQQVAPAQVAPAQAAPAQVAPAQTAPAYLPAASQQPASHGLASPSQGAPVQAAPARYDATGSRRSARRLAEASEPRDSAATLDRPATPPAPPTPAAPVVSSHPSQPVRPASPTPAASPAQPVPPVRPVSPTPAAPSAASAPAARAVDAKREASVPRASQPVAPDDVDTLADLFGGVGFDLDADAEAGPGAGRGELQARDERRDRRRDLDPTSVPGGRRRAGEASVDARPTATALPTPVRAPRGRTAEAPAVEVREVRAASARPVGRRRARRSIRAVAALGFAAMLALATSVPALSLLTPDDVQALALTASLNGGDGQRMDVGDALAIPGVVNEGYKHQTIAEYAEAAGIRAEATFTNNPAGTIQWPFRVGVHIGDRFGYRDCAGCSEDHHGQDFNPGYGAEIQAIADGVVSGSTDEGGSLGVVTMIDHVIDGEVVTSVYAHMQYGSRRMEVGDVVHVADVVGNTGSTGMSTGPHLHFEIRIGGVNGEWVDPLEWLYANTN